MVWDDNLPDVSKWQPQANVQDTLRTALMLTCRFAQRRIVTRMEAEITFNIHNFDSGSAVEDILREELANLLPRRYSIDAGVINDRDGNTVGDCDMIIRDSTWSQSIKQGATTESRRFHFPIEGVYAGIEIKQTMGYAQLDDAMQKLVKIGRLSRPDNPYGHITENQHITNFDCPGKILNPLLTTMIAARLDGSATFDGVVRRFGAINSMLDRKSMVKSLCVLDHGTAWYSADSGKPINSDYMRDRDQSLVLQLNDGEPENAFYRWYVLLMNHLTGSVLGLTKISEDYGVKPPCRLVISCSDAVFNQS